MQPGPPGLSDHVGSRMQLLTWVLSLSHHGSEKPPQHSTAPLEGRVLQGEEVLVQLWLPSGKSLENKIAQLEAGRNTSVWH